MTAAYGAWYSRRLPLRRLYPVNTSTLICVVCFICHNSKGKAKCAIILMDSSYEEGAGTAFPILLATRHHIGTTLIRGFPFFGLQKQR